MEEQIQEVDINGSSDGLHQRNKKEIVGLTAIVVILIVLMAVLSFIPVRTGSALLLIRASQLLGSLAAGILYTWLLSKQASRQPDKRVSDSWPSTLLLCAAIGILLFALHYFTGRPAPIMIMGSISAFILPYIVFQSWDFYNNLFAVKSTGQAEVADQQAFQDSDVETITAQERIAAKQAASTESRKRKEELKEAKRRKEEMRRKEAQEKQAAEKEAYERELKETERKKEEIRQREVREKQAAEKEAHELELKETERRKEEIRLKEAREKEAAEKEAHQRDLKEAERRKEEIRQREIREKEAAKKEAYERELKEAERRKEEIRQREAKVKEAAEKEAEARELNEAERRKEEARRKEAQDKEVAEKEAHERELKKQQEEARQKAALQQEEIRLRIARENELRKLEKQERLKEDQRRQEEIRQKEAREKEAHGLELKRKQEESIIREIERKKEDERTAISKEAVPEETVQTTDPVREPEIDPATPEEVEQTAIAKDGNRKGKVWLYSKPDTEQQPVILLNSVVLYIQLSVKNTGNEEVFASSAPLGMKLGDFFNHFINIKRRTGKPEFDMTDEQQKFYGWKFSTKGFIKFTNRELDPEISLQKNRLKEASIIVAKRTLL